MKQNLAAGIVKYRIWILLTILILTGISVTGISKVRINYDLNEYLSDETMTKRALLVMEEEFGSNEQLQIMFQDTDEQVLEECMNELNHLPEVLAAMYDPETNVREKDGITYRLVTLTLNEECDPVIFVPQLREMFPEAGEYVVGGSAADGLDVQRQVGEQMPKVMAIAVGIVFLILLLTSHAWLEPVVILLTLALSIVLNMGTNFIFPKVSFITFAVCAILQLALSIDYAIMLLHTYNGQCEEGKEPSEAMTVALAQTFMRIASSAFTTMAGLLSLLFMSFTIGFDIGIVLSKGIVFSMFCVFLLMPAFTLLFRKPLEKTRHKPLQLKGHRLADLIYSKRKIFTVLFIVVLILGGYLQSRNLYSFRGKGLTQARRGSIASVFGSSDPLALLIPSDDTDEGYEKQRELVKQLLDMEQDGTPVFRDITAMVTTGAEALEYYTVDKAVEKFGINRLMVQLFWASQGFEEQVRADHLLEAVEGADTLFPGIGELTEALYTAREVFRGEHYDRMILQMNPVATEHETITIMGRVLDVLNENYEDEYYLTGVAMSIYDIGNAFHGDLLKVNLITFFAIFLIIALSFRTLRIPVLLVFVIEGAIWVTMGISYILGKPIFFISYLICVAIQMGATIDYGILFCDQYRTLRKEGNEKLPALQGTMKKSISTILTSGSILITAGYIIGRVCTVFYISDIGLLLARGTFVSILFVLFLLPAILTATDSM